MINAGVKHSGILTVGQQARQSARIWGLFIAGLLGLTLALGLAMVSAGPKLLYPGLLLGLIGIAAIIWRPRYGVYIFLFLSVMGDSTMMPWYPFVKDLSSAESLLYINHSLNFSPLEACLVLTFLAWLGHAAVERQWTMRLGRLFGPVAVFLAFVVLGMAYGFGTGGDTRIGLWEARSIFYVPLVLLLVNNLLTRREHLNALIWALVLSLFVEGLVGCYEYFFVLRGDLGLVNSLTDHATAVHMNILFVLTLALWMYRGSRNKRFILPLLIPPVLLTYLAAERRAALVALLIGLALMALMLYLHRRRAFWIVMPIVAVAGAIYLGAFWSNSGALGLPARAVKSVIAPKQVDPRDESSNQYRVLENINVLYTIQQSPLTGVGFGQKFKIILPMPDISFFEWWQYLSHNSVMWIWMKTGLFGFLAFLFMVGWSISVGVAIVQSLPGGDLNAFALTATLYIVMHFVFAYVDISWDSRSMLIFGSMLGMLSVIERLAALPTPLSTRSRSHLNTLAPLA